ncbi:MAG: hypothetical protein C0516_10295 [Gemmatimonas sp.]|uniref:hypothetical protein n=1 Tax=Gemmatimonas sp. UBA7669 TaxID=1946568 RepID=UPI0025C4218A|nr:hypothetical protein [Gemmatimonas sp. UBA7669]MBA3918961.1 hypothetical protein [Gemmatimonas sp.]
MKRLLSTGALFLSLTVAACSGGSDNTGPGNPPPTPTIGIALSSGSSTTARGASATSTVTLTRGGGYTGEVSLAASGMPAGVTVTFAPATLSGGTNSVTATFSVGATAAPGAASITITASGSGVTSATATYSLTIPTPAIALTAGSTALSVVQGASGTVPITITRSNGFADGVTLAVSGLPTGVTGSFAPATIAAGSTTSTLTLNVAANAAAATTPITITASGTGVTAQTATVNLTVTAAASPAISLTANPAAVNVVSGATATTSIGIARTGGFAGEVTLALEGAPAGLTGTFSASPVPGTVFASILTLNASAAVAPGTYNLTVRGTGTGVTAQTVNISVTVAAAPGITLSTAASTLSLSAGATVSTAITIVRVGSFAGDVTLAATGLPTGVTASFAPATLSGATLTSTLTLTAAANATLGAATVTITASGAGITARTSNVALTVAAAQGFSLTAGAVSLTQGGTATSTVNITRTGGFAAAVGLAISGLPTGVTATINPTSVTGTSATITFNAASNAATGNFTATVTGTATGLANVTTTIAGSVTAQGGGGGNVNWTFCDPASFPLWFAVQNGSGAWTRVNPTGTINRVFSFTVGASGGVAYAQQFDGSSGVQVTVQYLSAAEMGAGAQTECQINRAGKTLNGTVANLTAGQFGFISVGGGTATVNGPATTYTINDAADGVTDLVGVRTALSPSFSFVPDRGVIRRNVNYAANSNIPVVDFQGAESFPVASANYTVANANGEQIFLVGSFITGNGLAGTFAFPGLSTGNVQTVYGVPSAQTQAGDLHQVLVTSTAGTGNVTSGRIFAQYNRILQDRTITLGAALNQPTITSLGSAPYSRWTATGTWQAEYGDGIGVSFSQQNNNTNAWTVTVSRSYAGNGGNYSITVPDFSGVAGFNNSWGIAPGSTNWQLTATGGIFNLTGVGPTGFTEGGTFRAGYRTGVTN